MRKFLTLIMAALAAAASLPAKAAPRDDATFVVDALITEKTISSIVDAMTPLIRKALSGELGRGEAKKLSQSAREVILDQFLKDFRSQFIIRMRQGYIEIYQKTLTEAELSGLKSFLRTPAGQGFAAKQPALIKKGSIAGQQVGAALGAETGKTLGRRLTQEGAAMVPDEKDRAILMRMFPHR